MSDDAPKPEKRPALTYGDSRYSYDEDDDEREAMQRECDCVAEHEVRRLMPCMCDCHPRKPDVAQRGPMFNGEGVFIAIGTRWVCADCYDNNHNACDGLRANGEPCECRRCADAARGAFN
jgi:hypothetical protein